MKLTNPKICTGCGACMKSCPKQAIVYKDDAEGFPTPYIINEKCIDCGICNAVCPALYQPSTEKARAAYAAQIKDRDTLKNSTSGGVFSLLAREIFRRGGVVYGCAWDAQYNAVITKAENEAELAPMRGSKYVWSWVGDTFPEIKAYLESGKTVLFTGLPCQVAGLKNYLKQPYENLYLMDFFCGGAPSPYAFRKYIDTLTKHVPLESLDFKFRDKEHHGHGVNITYASPKGKVHQSYIRNPYFFAYHSKVFHRSACYQCQYRYENRIADITMGDYWGVEKFHPTMKIRAGVSAVLVNSEQGAALLQTVQNEVQLVETKIESIAAGNNLTLGDKKVQFYAPGFRNAFFKTLRTQGWTAAEHKYLYNKTRLRLWIKQKLPKKYITMIKKVIRRKKG